LPRSGSGPMNLMVLWVAGALVYITCAALCGCCLVRMDMPRDIISLDLHKFACVDAYSIVGVEDSRTGILCRGEKIPYLFVATSSQSPSLGSLFRFPPNRNPDTGAGPPSSTRRHPGAAATSPYSCSSTVRAFSPASVGNT